MAQYSLNQYVDLLRAPEGDNGPLILDRDTLRTEDGTTSFPVVDGIPQMLGAEFDREVAALYEGNAAKGGFEHSTVGYKFPSHYTRMIKAFSVLCARFDENSIVADIGCGHGQMTSAMAKKLPVFGVDLSNNMLHEAKVNGLIPLRGDASALPFRDGVLDGVVSAEVVQHLPDLYEIFAEMARVTRPGATILLSTLNRKSIVRRTNRKLRGLDLIGPARLRAIEDFTAVLEGFPLRIEAVCWVMSPLPFSPVVENVNFPLSALAQNYVLSIRRA
jgi:SAM-dependent methyltransferase